ncbi:Leucine Rich repeat-containing domain protein [Paragonimus heterotremus]|uniref:Leucine Rich repeat-containing domain protein n=1 Tax=Paragonimus heterotremus TaxID=100268 RepID=A0A8J4SQ58_9TREM|nr:Leucine Rich repeat-containing domain protein [Paragonimus heterotremus]
MTFMTLLQRVDLERGKKNPPEVKELNLSHSKSTSIEGISDEFTALETLNLTGIGLESLSGLPKLPSLKTLELAENNLNGGLEVLVNCPNLEQLNLSSNKIESVDTLTPLAKLSNLRSLYLMHCKVENTENYRKLVFAAIPNLKYLDGWDENNESEPESEDQVGNFPNGDLEANGGDNEDENDSEDEDEDEEYGIEALQRSDDLEDDDEEDYAPGEEEEAELDEYDDIDEEDEEEEEDAEDNGANLSGAGVTGPRRPGSKRRHDDGDEVGNGGVTSLPPAKHKSTAKADTPADDGVALDE